MNPGEALAAPRGAVCWNDTSGERQSQPGGQAAPGVWSYTACVVRCVSVPVKLAVSSQGPSGSRIGEAGTGTWKRDTTLEVCPSEAQNEGRQGNKDFRSVGGRERAQTLTSHKFTKKCGSNFHASPVGGTKEILCSGSAVPAVTQRTTHRVCRALRREG